jgi:hypothetical protein
MGAPGSPNLPRLAVGRTWAENDRGEAPTIAFVTKVVENSAYRTLP